MHLRTSSLSLVGAGLVFASFSAHGQQVINGLAAVVNKEVVTFSQVRELVGPKEQEAKGSLQGNELVERIKTLRTSAINDLIDRCLIIQDFKGKGLTIPEYYIDDQIKLIIKEKFGGDRQTFLRTLAAQGYTLESFREMQRDIIIVQEMRKQAVKGVVSVPDTRIGEYYHEHADEYSTPEQIKLRLIAIRGTESDPRRKMIDEIRQKIVEGADFGELAHMYSDDPSQERFGDWGWLDRHKLNESLTKIAFALRPGEMSQVVELGGSCYLLYCEARRAASMKPLKEVHDEIEHNLLQTERQQQQEEWLQKLRRKAYVKIF